MPTVEIRFSPLAAHVRTARMFAVAVARRARVAEDDLDEIRLAVGEACSRAVALHQSHARDEPVLMRLHDDAGRFRVEVFDSGPAAATGPELGDGFPAINGFDVTPDRSDVIPLDDHVLSAGVGLAVITGLVDDVAVTPRKPVGTVVSMSWPSQPAGAGPGVARYSV